MLILKAWACCETGWWKGSKQVTERQTRWKRKKGRPSLRWVDYVVMDLRNRDVKEVEELWTEQNGHLS